MYRSSIAAHSDSDLIIWPEVALPAIIDQVEDYLNQVEDDVRSNGQTLLLGILERETVTGPLYNSMLLVGTPQGEPRQTYRKQHLVPFGEYFPVPDFVRQWMRMMSLPNSDLAAGAEEQALLVTAAGNTLALAICYEDAYGAEQLYAMPEADILINVSNDAWFGDSIAPHQHLEIARMRALEVGRYAVRATNNGVSAFIGPDGSILERGAQFEYVTMTRVITPLGGSTPYARVGNWPVISLCLLLLAGLAYRLPKT
jgi:apolipoprotein N-acyltransferase